MRRHHRRPPIGRQRLHGLVRPVVVERHIGKARIGREGAARIDHRHGIARERRHRRQRLGNVDRTHHDEPQRRVEDLKEGRAGRRLDGLASVTPMGVLDGRHQLRRELDARHDLAVHHEALLMGGEQAHEAGAAFGRPGGVERAEKVLPHCSAST